MLRGTTGRVRGTVPSPPPAAIAQNVEETHEIGMNGPVRPLDDGPLQVCPLKVRASPLELTTAQNVADGHETEKYGRAGNPLAGCQVVPW